MNERVTVPSHLLSNKVGDHYVLRVVGDSMIEESICDGDFVIILKRDHAEVGEMIVAMIGDQQTLKRYYPEGNLVRLKFANPAIGDIIMPTSDLKVQGIVVGLMRKY